MARNYTQTDTASGLAASTSCSTATISSAAGRRALVGGTPGSTPQSIVCNVSVSTKIALLDTADAGEGLASWAAGDYVFRMNVTTAAANCTWTESYVCERNAAGTILGIVASLTGQAVSVTTTGVKTMIVNRATAYTPAASTSRLHLVTVVTNSSSMTASTLGITWNQNIDTPLGNVAVDDAPAVIRPKFYAHRLHFRKMGNLWLPNLELLLPCGLR